MEGKVGGVTLPDVKKERKSYTNQDSVIVT